MGATVEVRRNDRVTLNEIENHLRPERIVISPGPGTRMMPESRSM
jgi:anthranilate/para-aminobenzoate synthase component II